MTWIRVTRMTSETPTEHEAVLLNATHIISIEQARDTTYVYLRDGRHFEVAESLEMLRTELMSPDDWCAFNVPRIVGRSKALEMFWTCEFLSAHEAKEIGLVDHVWPDAEFMERAMELALKSARGANLSNRLI